MTLDRPPLALIETNCLRSGFEPSNAIVVKFTEKYFVIETELLRWRQSLFYAKFINLSYLVTPHPGACTYIWNSSFFWVIRWFCIITACTKLFGYKCMHQYTMHLLIKSSNFEILKVKIDTQVLYDNSKIWSTQWDYIKTISSIFKRNWALK